MIKANVDELAVMDTQTLSNYCFLKVFSKMTSFCISESLEILWLGCTSVNELCVRKREVVVQLG